MNEFKTKRIRKGPPPSKLQPQKSPQGHIQDIEDDEPLQPKLPENAIWKFVKQHIVWSTILVILVVGMVKITWRVVTLAEEISIKQIVLSAFSEKIKTDEQNHTNILLLGTGDEGYSGYTLTDSIIVASIDHDTKWVSMLSLPRDFYVKIPELYGGNRINSISELYAEQEMYKNGTKEKEAYRKSYDVLAKSVSQILNIPIHYYARIDFQGFSDVVDALEGVDVVVKERIYDPFYPAENGTLDYTTFFIDEGAQHLDGKTALRYVRSRKTTSDFDRAQRQQQVLQAIKAKALSLGIVKKPSQLKELYDAIDNNFDTNLTWNEMVYLAKISEKFETQHMSSWLIHDNPLEAGGFLYTPERELYGGAYVLVPYVSDLSDIQRFADLVLMHPEVHAKGLKLQILNGTAINGLATETMYYLMRFGFNIARFGNTETRGIPMTTAFPRTDLLAGQEAEKVAKTNESLDYIMNYFLPTGKIATSLPAEYSPIQWETEADVILELGQDFVEWKKENKKRFY